MSRIAFFSIPAWGHVNPTVEVVRALTNRGHEVKYWSFAPFREKLEGAGAEVILCDAYLPPEPRHLDRKVGRDFAALVELAADTTLSLEETALETLRGWGPDVIVSDSVCFWGKLYAGRLGIPYVCSTTTFAMNQVSARGMKPSAGETVKLVLGMARVNKKLALLRDRGYPVTKVTDLIQNDNDTHTIVYTSREFQPSAETFSDKYAFVGPSLPAGGEETGGEKKRPLIYVSLGSVLRGTEPFFRQAARALGSLDADVVMVTDFAGPLPENCTATPWADQMAMLARADLFLTHCGMNSVSEALWFGVPMVLFPQQSEERMVADRLEELGAGLRARNRKWEAIREAVRAVRKDKGYGERALALGRTLRDAGGAEKAADFILAQVKN